jgi:hypothetical protein
MLVVSFQASLPCLLGSISSSARLLDGPFLWPGGRFNSLTRSAYRKVFRVFSQQLKLGEMQAIINVRQFPIKLSFKTYFESLNSTRVNLDPLNGV